AGMAFPILALRSYWLLTGRPDISVGLDLCMTAFLAACGALAGIALYPDLIRACRVDRRFVSVKGVCREFLACFPERTEGSSSSGHAGTTDEGSRGSV